MFRKAKDADSVAWQTEHTHKYKLICFKNAVEQYINSQKIVRKGVSSPLHWII